MPDRKYINDIKISLGDAFKYIQSPNLDSARSNFTMMINLSFFIL